MTFRPTLLDLCCDDSWYAASGRDALGEQQEWSEAAEYRDRLVTGLKHAVAEASVSHTQACRQSGWAGRYRGGMSVHVDAWPWVWAGGGAGARAGACEE